MSRTRSLLAILPFQLTLALGPAVAEAEPSIVGEWEGPGIVTLEAGQKEFVQCKVKFDKRSDAIFGFSAVCATKSVRVAQSGTVVQSSASRYFGDVYNPEFDVKGLVSVETSDANQIVSIKAAKGAARIVLTRK